MRKFTLVVRPDGRAILAAPEPLTSDEVEQLHDAFAGWDAGKFHTLVLADCEVVQVTTLELDLESKAETVANA